MELKKELFPIHIWEKVSKVISGVATGIGLETSE